MPTPDDYPALLPYVFARDAKAYIAHIIDAFEAKEIGRSLRPDGTVANCQLRFDSGVMMVSEAQPAYPQSRSSFYLFVADADAAMARALIHGAELEMDVSDLPYGDRQGGVRDIAGNVWWLSQRIVETPYFQT